MIPENRELEAALLGGLIQDPQFYPDIQEIFHEDLFFLEEHQIIARSIIALKNENKAVDIISVNQWVRGKGQGEKVPLKLISGLTLKAAISGFLEKTLQLSEYWIRRETIRQSTEAIKDAYEPTCDALELIGSQEKNLNALVSRISFAKTADALDCQIELLNHLEKLEKLTEGEIIGVPTGFNDLNRITAGFQKSDLIILAARPGMGKTSLMLNFVHGALAAKKPTLVFSLEMSRLQLYARMSAQLTSIPLNKYLRDKMEPGEKAIHNSNTYHLSQSPLFIDDRAGVDLNYIKAKSRKLKRDKEIELIVIDYLQLIGKGRSNRSTNDVIGEISGGLKGLAKELDVPIICLSQLSREAEKDTSKPPQLSHLRDSGTIEQDADMVMFIYRPEYYGIMEDEGRNSTIGKAAIVIAKNRNGSIDTVNLGFDGKCTNFYDLRPQSFLTENTNFL